MKRLITEACIVFCMSSFVVEQASSAATPTPDEHYQASLNCASIAVAVQRDPGIAASGSALDTAHVNEIVSDTRAIAIQSGSLLSKSSDQVVKEVNAGSLPYLKSLADTHGTDNINSAEARLGKLMVTCAIKQLSEMVDSKTGSTFSPK